MAEKQASLAEAKAKLREVKEKLEKLQKEYEEKLATKEELRKKAELTELRLDRAAKLVSGLAGERVRWEQSVKVLEIPFVSYSYLNYFLISSNLRRIWGTLWVTVWWLLLSSLMLVHFCPSIEMNWFRRLGSSRSALFDFGLRWLFCST